MKISDIAKGVQVFTKKHTPKILLGLGVGLGMYAAYQAVKATPEALDILDEELGKTEPGAVTIPIYKISEKFSVKDRVRLTWKCYIPAAIAGVGAVSCIIGAGVVDDRRIQTLTAAAAMSESALRDYVSAAVKTVGEKKEHDIRDTMAKDQLGKGASPADRAICTGNGETLCYDPLCDRYFKSSMEAIRRAENDINKRIVNGEDALSLNDLYYAMGLDDIKLGDTIGWQVDRGLIDLSFSSVLAPDATPWGGTPCLVVNHKRLPYPLL